MKRIVNTLLTTAALPLTWGLLTTESLAASFNVSIGGESFNINAFTDTERTLSDLYDYTLSGDAYDSTGHAIIPSAALSPGTTHFFLGKAIDGVGLFMVHDQPGDNATGGLIRTEFKTTRSKANFAALDDPDDTYSVSSSIRGGSTSSTLTAFQGWTRPFTDGAVIKWDFGGDFGDDPSLTAEFTFFDWRPGDFGIPIEQWDLVFFDNQGNNVSVFPVPRRFDFELDQTITFTPVDNWEDDLESLEDESGITEQTPEPSTLLGLFLVSGFGCLLSRRVEKTD